MAGNSGMEAKVDMRGCEVPDEESLEDEARKVSYGVGATKPLMVPKLGVLQPDLEEFDDGVDAAEGVVDSTTGVGSSFTLFEL